MLSYYHVKRRYIHAFIVYISVCGDLLNIKMEKSFSMILSIYTQSIFHLVSKWF